jgi:hypothetical protein
LVNVDSGPREVDGEAVDGVLRAVDMNRAAMTVMYPALHGFILLRSGMARAVDRRVTRSGGGQPLAEPAQYVLAGLACGLTRARLP